MYGTINCKCNDKGTGVAYTPRP